MKKIISLVFVIAMLFACTAPAFAESFRYARIVDDAVYDDLILENDATVVIDCNIKISNKGYLRSWRECLLEITENGSLTGEDLLLAMSSSDRIVLYDGGYINLSFHYSEDVDMFERLLGFACTRDGNRIVAGCSHSEWEDGICTRCGIHCHHETYDNGVCTVCGKACENEFHNGKYTCPDCGMVVDTTATGSVLSQGYPEIVYGIGGIAIGVVATLLFSRKKKVAVSSTSAEDEE